jgi:DNA topoisomerase IB
MSVDVENRELAAAAGLVYSADTAAGIRRRRRGRSFVYLDSDDRRVADATTLARIRALAVPPAYSDVWICTNPRGHLQATGRDARGRKQYRYHARWRTTRDAGKFDRMLAFGERLPRLRRIVRRDLALAGLPEAKVLAVIASLLAETSLRVGNEEYARSNGSYGLTTLRANHVTFLREGRALLKFRGKSGRVQEGRVDNARLVRILRRCQQLPGQALFQFIGDDGERRQIDSGMVNDYLRDAMDGDFTAKDFRTWRGTIAAIMLLARTPLPERRSERALGAAITDVVKQVADQLHNTPAVCRASYIHPMVFDAWRDGVLADTVPAEIAVYPRKLESAALKLLRRRRNARRRRTSA